LLSIARLAARPICACWASELWMWDETYACRK
jgi:hypothetical protein